MWKDEWFLDLEPSDKLLFIYLFSNERACLIGLYDIPIKVIAFETGLDEEYIKKALAKFENARKVRYVDGWIWIPNLMRYNAKNVQSPKIQGHIKNALAEVPDCELKRLWIEYYNGTVSYRYRIDTVCIPNLHEQEQEQEQEHNNDEPPSADAGASRPGSNSDNLPRNLNGWLAFVKAGQGQRGGMTARLHRMITTLYPDSPPPDYGRIGTGAKRVGGSSRLAHLVWMSQGYRVTGDVISYCEKMHKGGGGDGQKERPTSARTKTAESIQAAEVRRVLGPNA